MRSQETYTKRLCLKKKLQKRNKVTTIEKTSHEGAKDGKIADKDVSKKGRRDDSRGDFGKRKGDGPIDESEELGGSQVDSLIDEVEAEEQGVRMEDEEEEIEMIDIDVDDDNGEEELEDRVVDIEDKLDELMGEFEELMGQVDDNSDDIER